MSKKLIAGIGTVAALGIAALPLSGVFAEGEQTSQTIVRVNVLESVQCYTTGSDGDDFVWFGDVAVGQTATKAFTAYGATNDADGFTITGTPTALNLGTLTGVANDVRGEASNFEAASGAGASAIQYNNQDAGDGKWWVQSNASGVSFGNGTIILEGENAGQTYSYSLNAYVRPAATNPAGIYQGYINWVCATND